MPKVCVHQRQSVNAVPFLPTCRPFPEVVCLAQAHILDLVQQALKEASVKPKELDGIAYTKVPEPVI